MTAKEKVSGRKAMIFAAGLGSRLGSISRKQPKALVDVGGVSLLELAVRKLSAAGFNDIIVNVHHFAPLVRAKAEELVSGELRITISDESDRLLDTGGGLYKARHFFDDKPFLLYNVDIVSDLCLEDLYSFHMAGQALATLAVRHRKGDRYLLADEDGRLRGWTSRKAARTIVTDEDMVFRELAFSGIHVVSPGIFSYMEEGVYSITGLYLSLASSARINTFLHDDGYWIDAGTPENLVLCREMLEAGGPGRPAYGKEGL